MSRQSGWAADLDRQLQPFRLQRTTLALKCHCGRKIADVWAHHSHIAELDWTGVMDGSGQPVIDGIHMRGGEYRPRPGMTLCLEPNGKEPRVRVRCSKCRATPIVTMEKFVTHFIEAARVGRKDLKFGDNLPG